MLSDTCDIAAHEAVAEAGPETQPEHRGPGRPPIITLPVVEKVAQLIAKGVPEELACVRVGVNYASWRTALHRNPEFETAKKRKQSEFVGKSLDVIAKGTKGWQGLAWILERRHAEHFRRTTDVAMSGHVGLFSAGDLLAKKPLGQWTRNDVDASVGAWRILRSWSKEQLEALEVRYQQEWGPLDNWSDEKMKWLLAIGRREFVTGELVETDDADLSVLLPTAPNRIPQLAMEPPESLPDQF